MTSNRMKGKVAVVTGAARGIGKAVAERLALEGASVVLCDLLSKELDQTLEQFRNRGFRVEGFRMDISRLKEVRKMATSVLDRFDTLDILVNNAGVSQKSLATEITEEEVDHLVAVNLKGTFYCTQVFLPVMKQKRYGKIVNISSRTSLGKAKRTVYSATKAAIIGMTRTLALELASHSVNVNCVGPGPIATELFDQVNPKNSPVTEALVQSIPLQRLGTPEDVAALVAFLASNEASFITGQTVYICGGLSVGSVAV